VKTLRTCLIALLALAAASGCTLKGNTTNPINGGGGSDSGSSSGSASSSSSSSGSVLASGNNVQALSVNLGPTGNYINGLFTSVTVCIPGTSSCQTIDNVLVDTGSYGLRLLASQVSLALPLQNNGGGQTGECALFAGAYAWGPVATADLQIAGEKASSLPVQLIGTGNFTFPATAPSQCSSGGGEDADTQATLGSNGILGVGLYQQDCGSECVTTATNLYWSCTSSTCTEATEPLAAQVQNPVPLFTTDNNGVIVQLPSIPSTGQPTASGALVFGIGTESNNALGSAQILFAGNGGLFITNLQGTTYNNSFIDSGSNALYFATGITQCTTYNTDFYCPTTLRSLSANMDGSASSITGVSFQVADTNSLNGTYAAFDDLAGSTADNADLSGAFDWGMPFFYGRSVFIGIDGIQTPGGPGPFYAF
jgi:hypothetical protein